MTRTIVPGLGLMAVLGSAVAVVAHQPEVPSTSTAAVASSSKAVVKDVDATVPVAKPPTKVSRDAERAPLPNETEAEDKITGLMYVKTSTAIRADSDGDSPELATVAAGDTVDVTGKTAGEWTQIMHKGAPRWVSSATVSAEEPLGTSPCAIGSGVEKGLQPDTVKVYRAVCAKFPEVGSYGGIAGRGEHATGHSLDIMISSDTGNEIAAFLQENRAELGIEYLIWRQRIWRPATSNSWRGMSDRGGATANHMDHVHVTTYGTSATN